MITRNLIVALLSSTVVFAPAPAVLAQGAEAFVGGLIGSAIGTAITNQNQQRQQPVVVRERTVVRQRAPVVNTYQREENRRVQTALNYFGFPAGTPDGALGPNSRAAIGQYQAHMGYAPTGYLSDYEKAFLISSYDRAIVGGVHVAGMMASSGQGTRGLLHAFRQEQMGVPVATAPQPPLAAAPAPVQPQIVAAPPVVEPPAPVPASEPVPVAVVAPAPAAGLPSFLPDTSAISMASFCNRVNLATSASGGYVTLASMADPNQALGEQFCVARTYAVEQGDSLAAAVQGFTMGEMQAQCEAFAPSMWEYQTRLATVSPAETAGSLREFVAQTGASPLQLSGNARICLGIGYRTDNAELALAGAMVLVGLGEDAYGELLGHHLMNGFAAPRRTERGLEWLQVATEALVSGADPLVAAGASARTELIEQAVAALSGSAPRPVLQDAAAVPGQGAQGFVLPMPQGQAN